MRYFLSLGVICTAFVATGGARQHIVPHGSVGNGETEAKAKIGAVGDSAPLLWTTPFGTSGNRGLSSGTVPDFGATSAAEVTGYGSLPLDRLDFGSSPRLLGFVLSGGAGGNGEGVSAPTKAGVARCGSVVAFDTPVMGVEGTYCGTASSDTYMSISGFNEAAAVVTVAADGAGGKTGSGTTASAPVVGADSDDDGGETAAAMAGRVIVAGLGSDITVLDAGTLTVMRSTNTTLLLGSELGDGAAFVTVTASEANGEGYALYLSGKGEGSMVAFALSDLTPRWNLRAKFAPLVGGMWAPSVADDGSVAFAWASKPGAVGMKPDVADGIAAVALKGDKAGTIIWQDVDVPATAPPATLSGGVALYTGTNSDLRAVSLGALAASTKPTSLAKLPGAAAASGPVAMGPNGETIAVPLDSGCVAMYRFQAQGLTAVSLWTYCVPPSRASSVGANSDGLVPFAGVAFDAKGSVFVAGYGSLLAIALDPATGKEKWALWDAANANSVVAPPAIGTGGVLVFASDANGAMAVAPGLSGKPAPVSSVKLSFDTSGDYITPFARVYLSAASDWFDSEIHVRFMDSSNVLRRTVVINPDADAPFSPGVWLAEATNAISTEQAGLDDTMGVVVTRVSRGGGTVSDPVSATADYINPSAIPGVPSSLFSPVVPFDYDDGWSGTMTAAVIAGGVLTFLAALTVALVLRRNRLRRMAAGQVHYGYVVAPGAAVVNGMGQQPPPVGYYANPGPVQPAPPLNV